MTQHWWENLSQYARQVYSQRGEEGILEHIFASIGTTNKYLVDIGAGDGFRYSNTRVFLENGWKGLLLEGETTLSGDGVHVEWVSHLNVNDILKGHDVPKQFDLLSIDIDGQDYWVMDALVYRPRVIVCEFNPNYLDAVTVEKDPNFKHDGTTYYGASLKAMQILGERKGYVSIGQHDSLNMFMVRADLMPSDFHIEPITYQLYHTHPFYLGERPWIKIDA